MLVQQFLQLLGKIFPLLSSPSCFHRCTRLAALCTAPFFLCSNYVKQLIMRSGVWQRRREVGDQVMDKNLWTVGWSWGGLPIPQSNQDDVGFSPARSWKHWWLDANFWKFSATERFWYLNFERFAKICRRLGEIGTWECRYGLPPSQNPNSPWLAASTTAAVGGDKPRNLRPEGVSNAAEAEVQSRRRRRIDDA